MEFQRDPEPRRREPAADSPMAVTAFFLIAIAALYFGQGIFVPLVLAILLAFALAPVVNALRRIGLPRMAATIVTVAVTAGLLALVSYLVVSQLLKLAADLPQYQITIAQKVRALQETAEGGGALDRLAGMIERLGQQIAPKVAEGETAPLPVTIAQAPPSPLNGLSQMLGAVLGPLATAAIVAIFVVFVMLQREDLGDRLLKLISRGDLRTTTKAVREAAARVSRYLFVQFAVNASYGVVFGAGLVFLGIPNAPLWGLFAIILRYIPFVGTILAVGFPAALAFAVDPGWGTLAAVLALYFGMELVTTNAIEPRLYGSSTGLSALAVLVAAIFWATLWGPIGLILATPMTVCLVVLGRYVPQLRFLEVLLGSEPVLEPDEKLYQRLLAGNVEEAVEMAEAGIREKRATGYYDEVVLPALRRAAADLQNDASDLGPRRMVAQSVSALIEEVGELAGEAAPEAPPRGTVLAVGGKTELDGAAAEMVAQIATAAGFAGSALAPMAVRPESIGQLDLDGVDIVCLAYLGPDPRSYVRYVAARLRRRKPELGIVACLLGSPGDWDDTEPAELRADAIATDLAGLERTLPQLLATQAGAERGAAPAEAADGLNALRQAAHRDGWLEPRCGAIARGFDATLALAMLVAPEAADGPEAGEAAPAEHLARKAMARRELLVIEDVSADAAFAEDPYLLENGIQFCALAPLVTTGGEAVGALGIFDDAPRAFGPEARQRFAAAARELIAEIEARRTPAAGGGGDAPALTSR